MRSTGIATVLLLSAASLQSQTPWWQQPVVLRPDITVPVEVREGLTYKRTAIGPLRMDVYRPKQSRTHFLPSVVFVHGGPVPASLPVETHRIAWYTSLGKLAASHGIVAITFSHRLTGADADTSAVDVRDALAFVFDHANTLGIDTTRVCLWTPSAGGIFVAPLLREFPTRFRCLVLYYAMIDPALFRQLVTSDSSPPSTAPLIDMLSAGTLHLPPTLVVRAGRDNAKVNDALDNFARVAMQHGADIEVHAYAAGQHGFDAFDDTSRSRYLLGRTLAFIRENTARP
jgi:acetyl esterase/lipase